MKPARAIGTLALLFSLVVPFAADTAPSDYPAASVTPASRPGWDANPNQFDDSAPPDEAQGGMTEAGTPIAKRTEDFFPAEQRNLFWGVDQVVGPDGGLHPFPYSNGTAVPKDARDAIRGKNTWIAWGEGNEVFWDWVQQHGYGLADFLILLDSRQRGTRFAKSGLINQPGMKAQLEKDKRILGLYLDEADGDQVELTQPDTEFDKDIDAETGKPAVRRALPDQAPKELFEPGDRALYTEVRSKLARDGLDPSIYGYPSGIVGLRLFLNPNFFGNTEAAAEARGYWKTRVMDSNDAYYADQAINADPRLVRPFRVSMACGFCHIAPHPLKPPLDPEKPAWTEMSSTIGDQYWNPVATFVNLKTPSSFLYQFLASQQPGTIDTSLVSTDHINNSNTITAVFDVPARLKRAAANVPEKQSSSNLLIPYVEEPQQDANPRLTPRVLLDGADSVGVFGALSRVYLNIGAYSEEWKRLHNTVVGFTPQAPFAVATALKNSVYWNTADKYRIPYLAAFFTYKNPQTGEHVTQPMHLATTDQGRPIIEAEREAAGRGRAVFIQNCAICHSSKQPDGFSLTFSRDWAGKQKLAAGAPPALTLPMDFADWAQFAQGPAYGEYVKQITALAGAAAAQDDPFIKDNFLSNEIRVPITLVGTNSARAAGTNAMRGQIWDNFSSEDYKNLPAVGEVHFFNPFSGGAVDEWGNNDSYAPPGGGPGYYRPASLISLWATAPYLHNNALGEYTHDPSIEGRLKAFDDGIDKILWKDKRTSIEHRRPGDLRGSDTAADGDAGFIYRTTQTSYLDFPAPFIRQLIEGVAGPFLTSVIATWLWAGIALVALVLAFVARPRHAGFVFLLIAVLAAVALRLTRIDTIYPLLWLIPAVAVAAAALLWFVARKDGWAGKVVFLAMSAASIAVMFLATTFVNGGMGGLKVGPVPAGTPVNLIMNINPEAPLGDLLNAAFGMTRGFLRVSKDSLELQPGDKAWQAFREEAAGPLMRASKNPDFVLDRGHWFAETLTDAQKNDLKAFLRTL